MRTAGSWMALVAATTLGADVAAQAVHAQVRLDDAGATAALKKGHAFRLIVQSYDAEEGDLSALRSGRAKPVGSMQRVVSAEELAHGIRVDFVELRGTTDAASRPLVVAWLEGTGDHYELDAREARPRPGSVLGYAHRDARDVSIRLDRKA